MTVYTSFLRFVLVEELTDPTSPERWQSLLLYCCSVDV